MARTPLPRTVHVLLAVVLGAGALGLAGCSGDDEPAASKPSASASSSAEASGSPSASSVADPSASAEPVPAAPAAKKGRAGQQAFARHVMDLWGYALRTNDAKPLASLGKGGTCEGCKPFAAELAKRKADGWAVDFPGVDVQSVKLTRDGDAVRARAKVDLPESDSFNSDGTFRNTNKAHDDATFEVRMRFTGKAYRLLSFTVS